MTHQVRVLVLGAGGELGARVCRLAACVAGVEVRGASRSGRGPAGVSMERADVTDGASVARLLQTGDLVVNCTGPFHYDPAPLVAACIAARAHYCDLADDERFAQQVRAAAQAHAARAAGVLVCTGASTVPGTIGVLAGELAALPRASEIAGIRAYLSVGTRNPISRGLLASLIASAARETTNGAHEWLESARLRASDGRELRFVSYRAPFAGGTLALGTRRVPARFFFGFDRAALTALFRLAMRALGGGGSERRSPLLASLLMPLARCARVLGTREGLLAVVAEDAAGRELARIELTARERGLDIPAAPPAWIAARLARGDTLPAGALELADLVAAPEAFGWLRSDPAYAVSSKGPRERT